VLSIGLLWILIRQISVLGIHILQVEVLQPSATRIVVPTLGIVSTEVLERDLKLVLLGIFASSVPPLDGCDFRGRA